MKYIILPLLLLSLSIYWLGALEEINNLYITDDGWLSVYGDQHRNKLLEEAKMTRESLPSKDFPEGNWGAVTNGCQLSLRFTKTTYTNGEPIEAILLLRNVTNQNVNCRYLPAVGRLDGPARFDIISDSGEIIPEQMPPGELFLGSMNWPLPNAQHRYLEHLNKGYQLTNGTFTACAVVRVLFSSRPVEIKSATVPIKIEN